MTTEKRKSLSAKALALDGLPEPGPWFRLQDPSPDTPDSDGDTMALGALDFSRFDLNPVMFAQHLDVPGFETSGVTTEVDRLPVGTGEALVVGGIGYVRPTGWGQTELAVETSKAVANGTLRAVSLVYATRAAEPNRHGGEHVTKAEVISISYVNVPAKVGAVRVKSMSTPEEKPQQMPDSPEGWGKMLTEMSSKVEAMYAKIMGPPPEEQAPEEEQPPEDPEKSKAAKSMGALAVLVTGKKTTK